MPKSKLILWPKLAANLLGIIAGVAMLIYLIPALAHHDALNWPLVTLWLLVEVMLWST